MSSFLIVSSSPLCRFLFSDDDYIGTPFFPPRDSSHLDWNLSLLIRVGIGISPPTPPRLIFSFPLFRSTFPFSHSKINPKNSRTGLFPLLGLFPPPQALRPQSCRFLSQVTNSCRIRPFPWFLEGTIPQSSFIPRHSHTQGVPRRSWVSPPHNPSALCSQEQQSLLAF